MPPALTEPEPPAPPAAREDLQHRGKEPAPHAGSADELTPSRKEAVLSHLLPREGDVWRQLAVRSRVPGPGAQEPLAAHLATAAPRGSAGPPRTAACQ